MNRVYKLVWSKARNMYVAVSEIAKNRSKMSGVARISRTVVSGVLACVVACGAYMPFAEAAQHNMTRTQIDDDNYYAVTDAPDVVGNDNGSVAIGNGATIRNSNTNAVAIGDHTYARELSIAIGARIDSQDWHIDGQGDNFYGTSAEGSGDIVLGVASHATGTGTIILGNTIISSADKAVIIGSGASATADNSVAIGAGSVATEENSISVGNDSLKRKLVNVAYGTGANDVAAIGQLQTVTAGNNVKLVKSTNANGSTNQQIVVDGNGQVANGNTGLINGNTAFKELRPANGTYVKQGNSTAANLSALDVQTKANSDAIKNLGDNKANIDASNVAAYEQQWADAIGTGTVTADDTKLVTGKTVYDALHDPNMDINVRNITVNKDLNVSGDTHLHDTYIDGILDVTKESSFYDNVKVDKNLYVDGTSNLHDTNIDGKLDVTGKSHFHDDVMMDKDLRVKGTTHLGFTLVDDNMMVSESLLVVGDAGVAGNFSATDVYASGNLRVSGTTDLHGNTTIGTPEENADLLVNGNATVTGDSNLQGNADIGKDLHVVGISQLDGNTTIGTEDSPSDLYVTGNSNIGKNLTVQGTLDVMDNTHLHKDLQVDGNTNVGGDIFIGGNQVVDGDSNIKGGQTVDQNLFVGGDTNIAGDATVQKNLYVDGDTNISGNTTIQQNLTVVGDSNIKGSQLIEKDLTVNGDANVHGNGRVDKNFSVGGNSDFEGNVRMRRDLRVDGNATIGGTLTADQLIVGGRDMNREINRLDGRIDQVGAKSAALSGLRPVDTDADQVVSFAASYGRFKGENAAALGLFYRPTDGVLVGVGGTVGSSDNMMNASVSFALNKGKNYGMSKAKMAKEIEALRQDNEDMKKAMMAMAQKLGSLSLVEGKTAEFPDVPKDHWANQAVETLHGNNLVQGYPDGEFKGDKPMTRYEYAEILFNALSQGRNVKREHVQQYAPELQEIVRKAGKPEILQGYVTPEADADMQSAGTAYNAQFSQ